jgi:hypothetical protein
MDKTLRPNAIHAARHPWSERVKTQLRMLAHKQRCCTLPTIQPGEVEQLMEAFIAARGATQCPPAYVAAVQ